LAAAAAAPTISTSLRSPVSNHFSFPRFSPPHGIPVSPFFYLKSEAITRIDCQSNPTISTVATQASAPLSCALLLFSAGRRHRRPRSQPPRTRSRPRLHLPPEIAISSPSLPQVGIQSTAITHLNVIRGF
jgi:hypothetical protein